MIRRRILRSSAILATSIASLLPHNAGKAEGNSYSKKLRESVLSRPDLKPGADSGLTDPPTWKPATVTLPNPVPVSSDRAADRYPWKRNIVTTTFWVGEMPTKNNPVPNHKSSWDGAWAENYGGLDTPDRAKRAEYLPVDFTPRQNPFYIALPYNDVTMTGYKPEAAQVIPWFKDGPQAHKRSVCKGRWIAIRHKDRVAYAQWEDAGPFRTDHWQYVFGEERPKPNLNKGAGLDVSPAVRDFLGMNDTDVTDWKFVDFDEVPHGPWATHGDNNTFVLQKRAEEQRVASAAEEKKPRAE
jgi:hypothetical protein